MNNEEEADDDDDDDDEAELEKEKNYLLDRRWSVKVLNKNKSV